MPTASIRRQAMDNMVTLLKTIVPGSTYYRTLNIGDNVSTKLRFLQSAQEGKSFIHVKPGNENLRQVDISPAVTYESTFEILLDIAVKDETGDTMVEELEDLIHDIYLAIGTDRRLSGVVQDTAIVRIEPPAYSLEEMFAATTVHVVCTFDFDFGTTI